MGIEGSSSNNEVQNQEINQSTNEQIEQNQAEHQRSGEELEGNSTIDNEGERKQIEGKDDATESSERDSLQLDKDDSIENDTGQEQPAERESVSSEQPLDNQDTIDGVASSTDEMSENDQEIIDSLDLEDSIEDEDLSETDDTDMSKETIENLDQDDSIEGNVSNDRKDVEDEEDDFFDSDDTIEADSDGETTEDEDTDSENVETTEDTADESKESATAEETDKTDSENAIDENEEVESEDAVDETEELATKDTADESEESAIAEKTDKTDSENSIDENDDAEAGDASDENNGRNFENAVDVAEESNESTIDNQNGDAKATNIDDTNDGSNDGIYFNTEAERDYTEKNMVFENVSYHQGQNDLGALGTCGPTSIANSLNRVTDSKEYTENKVLHNAMDNNLCHKSDNPYSCGGTTTRDVVNIIDNVKNLDDHIHTEVYEYDKALSVEDLANRLADPGTVAMVGVDSATLWDQRGDVACSGLFQHTDSPSDHWITVDSPIRDDAGNLTGFNVIDSGGGVSEVSREKFEAMYMGDAGHTVSDPTAVIISNNGEAVNSWASPESLERTSNYKGSAEVSDGNDPPEKNEVQVGVTNTECDINGEALTDEAKEINDKFRGDNFDAKNSFESTFNDSDRKEIIEKNASTTCELNENLDGKLDGSRFSGIDKTSILEAREKVSEIKPDTVMQKVIPSGQVDNYLNGDWTQVRNCCSKAEDTAPYISCGADAYKELRLDYKGNDGEGCNVKELEENADVYIIRFTSDTNPSDIGIPNDGHPCTGTGFTGSENHLIPEYKYPATTPTDGAIYKIDADGNETMVGMWDKDANRFYPVL